MDKLLLLGNSIHSDKLLKRAQEREIYTILADNIPIDKSPLKRVADESWEISVDDYDALEEAARINDVNGIACGASELCMSSCIELCKRLGLPCYVSDRAWEITNNKRMFEEACRRNGVPVAKRYSFEMNFDESAEEISFPVVVKPVDGCSSLGVHVCFNLDELKEGYKDAVEKSKLKQVIVEQYIEGEEIMLVYLFDKGKATLLESGDSVGDKKNKIPFIFVMSPSKHLRLIDAKLREPLNNLFKDLGCNEGIGAVQCIKHGDDIIVFEMNYRLPGLGIQTEGLVYDHILNNAFPLSKVPINWDVKIKTAGMYITWLNKGTISKIEGVEKIKKMEPYILPMPFKNAGDAVADNTGMKQIFAYFYIFGHEDGLKKMTDIVNENLFVLDENGNDMLRKYNLLNDVPVLRG